MAEEILGFVPTINGRETAVTDSDLVRIVDSVAAVASTRALKEILSIVDVELQERSMAKERVPVAPSNIKEVA